MKFIEDVVSGKLHIGNYARLAVERHLKDLQVNDWEYYFSEEKATRAFSFISDSDLFSIAQFIFAVSKCFLYKGIMLYFVLVPKI